MVQRALIVGAGPGGLATAILLAQAGLQVQILERLPRLGGRTSSLEAHGLRFDLGPTFFLYPRILAEIYAAAGFDLHQEIPLVRLDPQYRLVFGAGGELDATPGAATHGTSHCPPGAAGRAGAAPLPGRQSYQARALPALSAKAIFELA